VGEWVDRNSLETPEDGEQVLVGLQGATRADDELTVALYVEAKDIFTCETWHKKVVRWMRIPKSGRRVRVDMRAWAEEFTRRANG
jgi:hypothetical protein